MIGFPWKRPPISESSPSYILEDKIAKLDFVRLDSITDDGNQALKNSRGDFNNLDFLIDH